MREWQVLMTEPSGRPRGALEREVLACLAAAGRPLTAGEVLADLGDGLAYTTVMTTLTRLHAKGVLTREASGRAYAYSLTGSLEAIPASLTAGRMRRLLDAGEDRAGVLARFVADLGPDDERLQAARRPGPAREPRTGVTTVMCLPLVTSVVLWFAGARLVRRRRRPRCGCSPPRPWSRR